MLSGTITREPKATAATTATDRDWSLAVGSTGPPLGPSGPTATTATTTTTTTHHTTDGRAGPEVRAGAVDGRAVAVEGDTNRRAQRDAQSSPLCRGEKQIEGSCTRLCAAQIRTCTHKL